MFPWAEAYRVCVLVCKSLCVSGGGDTDCVVKRKSRCWGAGEMGVHISKDTAKGAAIWSGCRKFRIPGRWGCVTERDAKHWALELQSREVHQLFPLTWLDLNSTTRSMLKGPRVMDRAFALRAMCLVAHMWVCGVWIRKKNLDKDHVKFWMQCLENDVPFVVLNQLL